MEQKQKVLEMRKRLDKTLASHDLLNEQSIKLLIKDQLLRSPFQGNQEEDVERIVEKRSVEVSNFLEMLRSASHDEKKVGKSHGMSHTEWKVKQDTDEVRVMYREGPHGTPFHTLLVEGYIDGPIDVCLCLSWESILYRKWWPQFNIPTFKITECSSLQKVRIGEVLSLVRVKVPWPVSEREALLHYFEIEFFKEDLVLVLLNTISDTDSIDERTHGFTKDGIPEDNDIVRIDLVGGFALQRVNSNRSYFRTIANMDIKLDFVPPWLINFISRQLIGNGYKLYQKAVRSVGTTDEEYLNALKEPMYVRIRESLYSKNNSEEITLNANAIKAEGRTNSSETPETSLVPYDNKTSIPEIVEEQPEQSSSTIKLINEKSNIIREPSISPEVEHALQILDKAIATVRQQHLANSSPSYCLVSNNKIRSSPSYCLVSNNKIRSVASESSATGVSEDGLLPPEFSRRCNELSQQFDKVLVASHKETEHERIGMQNGNSKVSVKPPTVTQSMYKVFNGSHESSSYTSSKQKHKRKGWNFGCLSPSHQMT